MNAPFRILTIRPDRYRRVFPRYSGSSMRVTLPPDLSASFEAALGEWQREDRLARLWSRDASLWTGGDEARWLGWLDLDRPRVRVEEWRSFAREVRSEGFTEALLVGMGGSSLCPAVLATTFGASPGFPRLRVLDSIDPAEVRRVERSLDLARTLLIVSSKSGTTIESDLLFRFFRDRLERLGGQRAPRQLVAVTDPGSPLFELAQRDGFRAVFAGDPEVGGRFSALTAFGLVPAAILGLGVGRFLTRAKAMADRCAPSVPVADNPGARLGLVLGVAGRSGRDKITLVVSPSIAAFAAWVEQLLAESTGKAGRALMPVVDEPLGPPTVYGHDRLFVYLRDGSAADVSQDAAAATFERAGWPTVWIELANREEIAAEFFRWELATAVAGAVLGINPFDQPDVESSKVATRRLIDRWESSGAWPEDEPVAEQDGLRLYAADRDALPGAGPEARDRFTAVLAAHLARLAPGRYFALLAFVERSEAHVARLQAIRRLVRDRRSVATSLGFGPRYLHSTGQAHKGGPDTGVFLMVVGADAIDVPVPGRRATFGAVKAAQARGDFEVLASRGRPIVRIHLGPDVAAGLDTLHRLVDEATRAE